MIIPGLRTPPADTEKAVTDDYVKAVNLNYHLKAAAQVAQQSLYEMCKGFKEMRDSKLYKELGYSTFEDYCEKETGIKRRQVYRYIEVIEKLPSDFVSQGTQIGVKKLYLLSSLSEEERTEITENTDLENTSVRELEQQIRQIRAEKDKAVADKSAAEAEASAAAQQAKSLEKAKNTLSQQIAALEAEIKELENRPIDVEVALPDGAVDKDTFTNICKTYEEQIDKVQEDTIRLSREHTEQMNSLKAENEKKLEELRSQLEAAKREQSELTVSVPDSKETFKAYLATAIDAAKRLCEFIGNNSEDSNHDLFVAKAKQFFTKMTEEI